MRIDIKLKPTDCSVEFLRFRYHEQSFANNPLIVFFQVFGLGNKTYEHYNEVGINVDHRLEQLGATRVFELGLGDDDAK